MDKFFMVVVLPPIDGRSDLDYHIVFGMLGVIGVMVWFFLRFYRGGRL